MSHLLQGKRDALSHNGSGELYGMSRPVVRDPSRIRLNNLLRYGNLCQEYARCP